MRERQFLQKHEANMIPTPTHIASHDPLAEIERHLISAYVAGAGHDLDALLARTDEDAKQLLAQASRYASAKMSEVEARSHYLHKLHGEA
jgi:hypothetical protein